MKISELTSVKSIFLRVSEREKFALLRTFCQKMEEREIVDNASAFLAVVEEREQTMSTGIGYGIAIPHGRYEHTQKLHFFLIRTEQPLDFDSLDGLPVRLIFLLAVPLDQAQMYGRILQVLSRFLVVPENRERLLLAQEEDQIYQILKDIEDEI